jgi:hypothetical protein
MAAIAHGTLSRGASIAFFVGRDKLTGWDVARHAREIDAGFPVVYMTGANADDWASKECPTAFSCQSRSRRSNCSQPFLSF